MPHIAFMDTTVKSGGDFAKQFLAPSWDMLQHYRSGGTEEEYTVAFLKKLTDNKDVIVRMFSGFINRFAILDLILGCYCRDGKFCHRHLLYRFLLEHVPNVEPGGELLSTSFEMVEGYNPVILSFINFNDEAEKACQQLIGNEYTLRVDTSLSDSEKIVAGLLEAKEAIGRRCGPILDKEGLFANHDDPDIQIITVKTVDDIYTNFFKRWPLPAPEKQERRFTEWMDELYHSCLPKEGKGLSERSSD